MATLKERAQAEKHPTALQSAIEAGERRLTPLTDDEFRASMHRAARIAGSRGITVYATRTGGISVHPWDKAEVTPV